MVICPACSNKDAQRKDGRTAAGSQRYKCKQCSHRYTVAHKEKGYEEEIRLQALTLYLEGVSLRGVARILDVNHQSVANWVNQYANDFPEELPDSILEMALLDGIIIVNPRKER